MDNSTVNRRAFVGLLAAVAVTPALPAWRVLSEGARLTARPGKPSQAWKVGLTPLWAEKPGAFLYIPKSYDPANAVPLVVALHGAGQRANFALRIWTPHADAAGFVLLAPESGGMTWDAIRGEYGDDVTRIDRALKLVFAQVNVDPNRVVMEGFSDGASYGIGLALNNRDLFTRIVANSPGLITRYDPRDRKPRPKIYVSHGHQDQVLPYEYAGPRVWSRSSAAMASRSNSAISRGDTRSPRTSPSKWRSVPASFPRILQNLTPLSAIALTLINDGTNPTIVKPRRGGSFLDTFLDPDRSISIRGLGQQMVSAGGISEAMAEDVPAAVDLLVSQGLVERDWIFAERREHDFGGKPEDEAGVTITSLGRSFVKALTAPSERRD
jgi:phospholipase/carboxylesterase